MKNNTVLKTAFIAAVVAVAALCGTVRPVLADLTGPKPPKVIADSPVFVSQAQAETR